jgi:3'-phosphoadenosine 5'-phosphosulfate sulfotransferase (PAPS reductase)/FAD synthetase
MIGDPFFISGPAIISFSGGRTSALMLRRILDAHGGQLPADVHVAFANTGKERPETLRFVHECEARWGVRIHWLEWRATPSRAAGTASLASWLTENDPERRMVADAGFEEVGFNSASRHGEPFAALIAMKQRLPNWQERWCTEFLKVWVLTAFAAAHGWAPGSYLEVIGLRDDEQHRILRAMSNAEFRWDRKLKHEVPRDPPRRVFFPLQRAGIRKVDVLTFWLGPTENTDAGHMPQGFDLGLRPHEGNCDWCFMKGRALRKRIARDAPWVPGWWAQQEAVGGRWFDRRDHASALIEEVRRAPELFDAPDEDDEFDGECGTHCAPMEEGR